MTWISGSGAFSIPSNLRISPTSGEPNRNKVGTVSREQVRRIAELKMPDLNAFDLAGAEQMVMGTARSMGIVVED